MLGDEQRGWAWTRALLGLPASEIHVCGDMSAIDLVRQLCAQCGDEFTVQFYDRWGGWRHREGAAGVGLLCSRHCCTCHPQPNWRVGAVALGRSFIRPVCWAGRQATNTHTPRIGWQLGEPGRGTVPCLDQLPQASLML